MCHNIYLYTHTHTHTDTRTHSRADLTVYFVIVHESPWVWKPLQQPLPPASVHIHTLNTHTHTQQSHALIFLAIVQRFYSSKPYHKSLHSSSLSVLVSLARTHKRQASACVVLIVFFIPFLTAKNKNLGESQTQSLISQKLLSSLVLRSERLGVGAARLRRRRSLLFVYHLRRGRSLLWCKHRARLVHPQTRLHLLRKKHTRRRPVRRERRDGPEQVFFFFFFWTRLISPPNLNLLTFLVHFLYKWLWDFSMCKSCGLMGQNHV